MSKHQKNSTNFMVYEFFVINGIFHPKKKKHSQTHSTVMLININITLPRSSTSRDVTVVHVHDAAYSAPETSWLTSSSSYFKNTLLAYQNFYRSFFLNLPPGLPGPLPGPSRLDELGFLEVFEFLGIRSEKSVAKLFMKIISFCSILPLNDTYKR